MRQRIYKTRNQHLRRFWEPLRGQAPPNRPRTAPTTGASRRFEGHDEERKDHQSRFRIGKRKRVRELTAPVEYDIWWSPPNTNGWGNIYRSIRRQCCRGGRDKNSREREGSNEILGCERGGLAVFRRPTINTATSWEPKETSMVQVWGVALPLGEPLNILGCSRDFWPENKYKYVQEYRLSCSVLRTKIFVLL